MVQMVILATVVVYLLGMLAVGFYFQQKGMEDITDFFLAGKGAPWYLVALSFFATAIGAGGTIGLVAGTFESESITEFWSYGITLASSFVVAFLLGLQGVLLSALLTFAPEPWYGVYVDRLGDDALSDQHIAGVLMWVPLGALITAAGIWAAMAWVGPDDEPVEREPGRVSEGTATESTFPEITRLR